MKSGTRPWLTAIFCLYLCIFVNSFPLLWNVPWLIPLLGIGYLAVNLFPSLAHRWYPNLRLRICGHGETLLRIFFLSLPVAVAGQIALLILKYEQDFWFCVGSILFCILAEAVVFWNGMISVYCTSVQLGIRERVLGFAFGLIFPVNLYFLGRIIRIVSREIRREICRELLERSREDQRICATKYPILLVHGVFFRDSRALSYWGRIPKTLKRNGAMVYYGNQPSAASVPDCGRFLSRRIREIVEETGCEKVNIIAHSKGGLDSRYALAKCDALPYVASLTTVNTPHKGCAYADWLMDKVGEKAKRGISSTYNEMLGALGEDDADFLAAVSDLTEEGCRRLNEEMGDAPTEIFCQSIGSVLNKVRDGKILLGSTSVFVRHFDGKNDGLVGEASFPWGEKCTMVTTDRGRGISHADIIDLGREDLPDFDVREFYVNLVSDLKQRGL